MLWLARRWKTQCECIFSSVVRLWWLIENRTETDREGRCFKVCTTTFLAPTVVSSFLSQIVVATRYYFFTVIYPQYIFSVIVMSVNTLYSIPVRNYIFTASRLKTDKNEFVSLNKHLNDRAVQCPECPNKTHVALLLPVNHLRRA